MHTRTLTRTTLTVTQTSKRTYTHTSVRTRRQARNACAHKRYQHGQELERNRARVRGHARARAWARLSLASMRAGEDPRKHMSMLASRQHFHNAATLLASRRHPFKTPAQSHEIHEPLQLFCSQASSITHVNTGRPIGWTVLLPKLWKQANFDDYDFLAIDGIPCLTFFMSGSLNTPTLLTAHSSACCPNLRRQGSTSKCTPGLFETLPRWPRWQKQLVVQIEDRSWISKTSNVLLVDNTSGPRKLCGEKHP